MSKIVDWDERMESWVGGELCQSKNLHYHVKGTNQGGEGGSSSLGEYQVCRLLYDPSVCLHSALMNIGDIGNIGNIGVVFGVVFVSADRSSYSDSVLL